MVLSKIKKMNKFVQAASTSCVDFNEMANLLSEELKKPTMVVAKNGRLLGKASWEEYASDMDNINVDENDSLDKEVISVLSKIDETKEGLCKEDGLDILCSDDENGAKHTFTAVPIYGMGERLATLLVVNDDEKMADDDLVMCEHAATLMAMGMITSSKERIAEEVRRKSAVQMAIGTLSYSEQEAVEHIFEELTGDEGLLVASRIADRVGITRSVIVNALRKFESAGIIESRSLGMKGTYIRVLNEKLFDELDKMRAR